ncbi:uncharacterized protein (DUF305 family) [Krasilnikovia cinnamomea]|uniref:Uncharacterized protein (DUF305 family) n=1 Tax=Krasilnikovia cinnamomea TaxID=349313 RepID=A0A4Q7ZQ28_9ACTN|nr:DUF305 domain-containing protein [Krasilnikovia cinnamomea]RZU53197.1 uncharacterized protein (DUF305 family) [Krasilnikovia cinnamomea]
MLAGVAAAAAFVVSACGGGDSPSGSDHGPSMMASPGASASAAAFNDADVMFAQMMIPHHQQAIEMAELAETRAADPEVKALAGKIKAAQQPEIDSMTGWLHTWDAPMPGMSMSGGMSMPSTMPSMGHGMPGMMSDADMGKLEKATGKEFDKQFCTMMIAHHEGAVTMAKDELAKGVNPEAKAMAQQIITAQEAEITQMKQILARL